MFAFPNHKITKTLGEVFQNQDVVYAHWKFNVSIPGTNNVLEVYSPTWLDLYRAGELANSSWYVINTVIGAQPVIN